MSEAITPNLSLSPSYHQAVNVITQPDRMVFTSRYLLEKWLPDLGGDGLAILLLLRKQCYHNRKTGELRNTVQISLADIARGCALSVNTVRRQFQNNQALRAFVTWREEYVVEGKRNGVIQAGHSYTVSMDDPLHPSDLPRLEDELRRRHEEAQPDNPKDRARRQAETRREALTESSVPTPSQNERALEPTAPSQNERALHRPAPSQNERALREVQRTPKLGDESIDYFSLPKTKQTTTTRQPETNAAEAVVVASAATLLLALQAEDIAPKVARKLLDQYGEEAVRQQIQWLPQRQHDPQKGTRAGLLRRSIEEAWTAPAGKKPLPRPKLRAGLHKPAEANAEDVAAMRAVVTQARQKTRLGNGLGQEGAP